MGSGDLGLSYRRTVAYIRRDGGSSKEDRKHNGNRHKLKLRRLHIALKNWAIEIFSDEKQG